MIIDPKMTTCSSTAILTGIRFLLSRITRLRAWPLLAPAAWVAMEFAAGKVPFGGFSWARLGYTAVDQPLSGWCRV